MSSDGDFMVPPPFGDVGDYASLPSYGIDTHLKVQWSMSPDYPEIELWLFKDGDSLFCSEFYLAKTSCVQLLGK